MTSLILASGSFARKNMLQNVGYDFDVVPADIDEEKIKNDALKKGSDVQSIAQILANEKAKYISQKHPKNYIVGSDQVLIYGGKMFSKSKNKQEARERLKLFSGKVHYLVSAVSVYRNEEKLFSHVDAAMLSCKKLNDREIENYCEKAGDILTQCVGGYAYETIGLRLFEEVEGEYFSILGMPLLPLKNFLDSQGFLL